MPAYTSDSLDTGGRRQVMAGVGIFVLSLVTLFLPATRQQQVAAALRVSVLRPFVAAQSGLTVARSRTADASVLRRQVDSLVVATSGHWSLAAENRHLRDLLAVKDRVGPFWIPAGVVRSGTIGSESTFMLDVGSDDGVVRYAPIITADGAVGRVQEVYPRTSLAIDWTHPDFRVSAMDRSGVTFGVAQSRRGEFREADRLEFNGTAYTSLLEDGTVIVSNGLGGVWPLGVPLGKVDGLSEADDGWRKSYWLRPMVELGSVTHVLVGVDSAATRDLSTVWPTDSILTGPERALREWAREDSLVALRTILAAPLPLRDSVLAAMLLGTGWTPPAEAAAGAPGPATGGAALPAAGPARGGASPASGAGVQREGSNPPAGGGGQRGGTDPGRGAGTQPGRPAGQPAAPSLPPRIPPATQAPSVAPDPRFPRPTDTIRIRPDTSPGRGRGVGPDTTSQGWEGGARPR